MTEPTDIVERLLDASGNGFVGLVCIEAAAEIERLRAENKIAEAAVREYADEKNWDGSRLPEWHRYPEPVYERGKQALKDMENVK